MTDANVVLGRLNPIALVGGSFPIDAARAHEAVRGVAAPLGGDVERTAAGIVALVDAEMAKVLRIVSVERGLDPRDFALMAFGGGGPLHACALAADFGDAPGDRSRAIRACSARSACSRPTCAQRSRVRSSRALDATTHAAAARVIGVARRPGASGAARTGRRADAIRTVVELDVRYAGQSFDLTVPFEDDPAAIAEAFHRRHERRYGYASRDEIVEIATVRVTAIGAGMSSAAISAVPRQARDDTGRIGTRRAGMPAGSSRRRSTIANASARAARFAGPGDRRAIRYDVLDTGGWSATVDSAANLLLEPCA